MSEELQVIQNQLGLLSIVERAMKDPSIDVEKMERIMALAIQLQDRERKLAFDLAMNEAQAQMRPISRDCHNPQTRSRYSSYEKIDTDTRPIYTACGFSMRFGSRVAALPDQVIVTCHVTHRAGHSELTEITMPADGKGAKGNDLMTKTHATGSALSYGKRYIAMLVWNLSFGEADDDGNSAGKSVSPMEDKVVSQQTEMANRTYERAASRATEKTRERMLVHLTKFPLQTLELFAASKGYIALGRPVTEWKLEGVPTSREALDGLILEIENFVRAEENRGEEVERARAEESKEFSEPFWNVKITLPRRGMKRSDYRREEGAHMDTINSLYTGSDEDRKRLFGIVGEWHPSDWTDSDGKLRPPSDEDLACRKALDTFSEWHKNK